MVLKVRVLMCGYYDYDGQHRGLIASLYACLEPGTDFEIGNKLFGFGHRTSGGFTPNNSAF